MGLIGFGSDSGKRRANRFYKKTQRAYADLLREIPGLYAPSILTLMKSVEGIEQGFDQARSELNTVGNRQRDQLARREQRGMAQADRDTTARGLSNTTIRGNQMRGIASDTDQRYIDLESSLAPLYSGLQTQKTMAIAGAQGNVAEAQMNQGKATETALQNKAGWLQGTQQLLNSNRAADFGVNWLKTATQGAELAGGIMGKIMGLG